MMTLHLWEEAKNRGRVDEYVCWGEEHLDLWLEPREGSRRRRVFYFVLG
jgi:hypothetical protein